MTGIVRPWTLLFIVICAVAVVWSSGSDDKRGNKASSARSMTYDDPQQRRKVLKRFRGIASLRRIQRAKRQETYTYTVCLRTCNVVGAGAYGSVLVNIVTTDGQSWDDYVTLSPDSGFEYGQCYCADFQKPKLTSQYSYNVIIKLDADDADEMKPDTVWVKGPGQISACDFVEQCEFWSETCWLVNEDPKRINQCNYVNFLPTCPIP